jgi:hypothetical protein
LRLNSTQTTSPLVLRRKAFPLANAGAVKALPSMTLCRAKFLVAGGRGFSQHELPHLGEDEQLSTNGHQSVELQLWFRPLDFAGLPIPTTQRRRRTSSAF